MPVIEDGIRQHENVLEKLNNKKRFLDTFLSLLPAIFLLRLDYKLHRNKEVENAQVN